jgi:HK97 family phage major capsid protein
MTPEELKAQLETLETNLKAAASADAKKQIQSQIDELKKLIPDTKKLEDGINDVKKTVGEIAGWQVKKDETDKLNQAALDELISAHKEAKKRTGLAVGASVKDAMHESFESRKKELAEYKENRRSINVEIKTVGDIGANSNFAISGTQTFAGGAGVPGVGRKPYELSHIRELMTILPVEKADSIYVIRDAGGEGAPTSVAKGAAKPQSDRDYTKLVVPVTKIAHFYRIPDEWLDDLDWLSGEISSVGMEELLSKEDDMILNNAAGGEFQGLVTATNSTAFAAPTSLASLIDGANNYDALVAAWTQLRNAKVSNLSAVLVNPSDYAAMILAKATTGEYLFGAPNVTIPNIFGTPIVPHTAITSDKFLIGDFKQAVLGQRKGLSVRFYDQDADNATKNMVTVVIEERVAVVARRDDKLVYGDFSVARAALELGS